jgi:hypothetical protein
MVVDHREEGEPMYTLSPHARQQIASKGFDEQAVLAAANDPDISYDNGRFPGQRRHIANGICAVVDPSRNTVVTVYLNCVETEVRPDQLKGKGSKDAKRYAKSRR